MIKKALKGSLAAVAGLALAFGSGGVATAQDVAPFAEGDIRTEGGVGLNGLPGSRNVNANIIKIELDGTERITYCIQINVGLKPGYTHQERAWDEANVDRREDLPRVLGVLTIGFNGSNAADLIDAAGVGDNDFGDYSERQIAYAGTQAAVWALTDSWEINADNPTIGGEGVDAAVLGIQTYLLDNAESIEEPDMEPYFETDDSEAAVDGAVYGPFTVSTNLGSVKFQQPEGATIIDENGEAITEFTDGQVFSVEFDEAETGSISLVTESVTWTTPVGRTFVPVDGDSNELEGQNLILAEAHEEELTAELEFEITIEDVPEETTPAAQPKLPKTGTDLTMVAGIGAGVLAAGVVALVLMRRRAASAGAGADWGSDDK